MIWDAKTENIPVRLIDANGKEWFNVCWFNTETGEGEILMKTDIGFLIGSNNEILRQPIQMKAPIQILSPLP